MNFLNLKMSMQKQQKMLETDFPLTGANPKMRRSSSTKDASSFNNPGITRQNSGSARKVSSGYSADPREPLMASEWQYESARSMSRIQTSFDRSGSVSRDQGVQANLTPSKAQKSNGRTASLNRTASLRKACSDESSELEEEDEIASERSPLRNPSKTPVQTPSSTSDYHSDEIHQHRRTNSFHGGGITSLTPPSKPTKPVPVESNPVKWTSLRHRKDDDDKMSGGAACCLTMLVLIAQIFLHGILGLVLYWVIKFHTTDGASFPFAWRDDLKKQFNLHPVLMVTGFIYFSGQAMLFYRSCRCCRRIWSKLFHTMFHLLAIPCIVIGFLAVLDSHNLRVDQDGKPAPIPNFYSLHSWMGATCMGLFALQFIAGFFSFLLLLCCESATASFRASLVPIHSAFGLTTFVLAVATACSGFTEKAFFTLSTRGELTSTLSGKPVVAVESIGNEYTEFVNEGIIINTMGIAMVALAILIPCILKFDPFRKGIPAEGGSESDEEI